MKKQPKKQPKKHKISLNVKVAAIMLLATFLLALGTTVISYVNYTQAFNEHYEDLATSITKTTSSVINKDCVTTVTEEVKKVYRKICDENGGNPPDVDEFTEEEKTAYYEKFAYIEQLPEYKSLLELLKKIREDNDVVSLYVGYTDVDTMRDLYIVDASGEDNAICMVLVDISMEKISAERKDFLTKIAVMIVMVSVFIFVAVLLITDRTLLRPIKKLSDAANGYTKSQNDEKTERFVFEPLKIKTGDEIEDLYDSLRQMENDINSYINEVTAITAEKERIGAELDVARHIQASMLPCIFPAFPERHEFDVFASMTPAKEVGGDFYDFFLVDDDHLAVVMADVSGKGVPAALFMMISKTLIKSAAQNGLSPKDVLEKVNNQLCENNDAEMFVTVWLGIVEISTGKVKCANAGHEYPAIMRNGGDFELYKDKHGFVLAGMEGAKYREYEINLNVGDRLFVYTDGVPEATDANNTLYGVDRMLCSLNRAKDYPCSQLLKVVHDDVDAFVGDAPQFDDITMLVFEIKSAMTKMKEISVFPSADKVTEITKFLEDTLTEGNIPAKFLSQADIVADEIFSNIALYSGATVAKVGCEILENGFKLRFSDNGTPYDPTKNPDPDTTLSADERKIGGLGIFMVKKMTDEVSYRYVDGWNVLTLIKKI